jgi:transcriptional regulator with XRE-family HTH domain
MPERKKPKDPLDHEPESVTWAREQAGLTQKQLAGLVGISPSLMSEIEKGTRNATPPVIKRMAVALNCPRPVLERKRHEVAA